MPGARQGPSEAVELGPDASQMDQPTREPSWLASGKNWPSGKRRKNEKMENRVFPFFHFFPEKIEK